MNETTVSYSVANIIADLPEPRLSPRERWKIQHRLARVIRKRMDEMTLIAMYGGRSPPRPGTLTLPQPAPRYGIFNFSPVT